MREGRGFEDLNPNHFPAGRESERDSRHRNAKPIHRAEKTKRTQTDPRHCRGESEAKRRISDGTELHKRTQTIQLNEGFIFGFAIEIDESKPKRDEEIIRQT